MKKKNPAEIGIRGCTLGKVPQIWLKGPNWLCDSGYLKSLDLQENEEGIYIFKGRIEGAYPTNIPKESPLAEKIIFTEHKGTLHSGVIIAMTSVRSRYWIPSLRQQTKSVIHKWYGCKNHCALPYPTPKPEPLPLERTKLSIPFQIIGRLCRFNLLSYQI